MATAAITTTMTMTTAINMKVGRPNIQAAAVVGEGVGLGEGVGGLGFLGFGGLGFVLGGLAGLVVSVGGLPLMVVV